LYALSMVEPSSRNQKQGSPKQASAKKKRQQAAALP
jgi:hypothetical protein